MSFNAPHGTPRSVQMIWIKLCDKNPNPIIPYIIDYHQRCMSCFEQDEGEKFFLSLSCACVCASVSVSEWNENELI